MMGVRETVVAGGFMATDAEVVSLQIQLSGVGVMAIGAGDPLLVHAALEEGPVDIHLVKNLTVGVVETLFKKRQLVSLGEYLSRNRSIHESGSPGVTAGTGFLLQ